MAAVVKMARRAHEQREPAIGRDAYIVQLVDLLFERLLEVVRLRQPEIEANLRGDRPLDDLPPALLLRALQAYGIWFQLLAIAEENATIRTRRRIERDGGPDALPGTFSHVIAKAAATGVEPAVLQDLLDRSLIQPVLTAHPTEAKRVTVLTVSGGQGVPGPTAEQLLTHLQRNGIAAKPMTVGLEGKSTGEAILRAAKAEGCDLLVKGAFTQSRLRQMIFGGATSHILANAELPVLMAH